jgi:predicted enzyme related to lactoylglutathione lyase
MRNALNWFEIPVRDIDRATRFYEAFLGRTLRRELFGGLPYGVFPFEPPGISGAIVQDPRRSPGSATLVYLNANGELDDILARAATAGASVLLPKTSIGKDGYIAIVVDSEGNHVGLSSEG